ncbi:pantoate--beta-alanine ligase [Leifsonia xyli subsp. xyli str. CTCB07]|uniref:Pantothenate synthetase n=1 Tax=Leifsonia xyli subsp. xyli (strain CTCB07) TaxID=281090 RepID=PANC_LEIXX|nr:RecName: Full=Pantothenate synthetase; Short=PS; AltName: Full=Pantoate--beta-alanine ligase; AltName: Full=Pantoate-activating enzyme [Leifsonia xyli subsp. xyli str. CTCB07]AAT89835.1 pantoate--beta-alanine ligase [Leifsonia xyli subsp. xyli str. CTCB07]
MTVIACLREILSTARRTAVAEGASDAPASRVVLVPTMGALHEGHVRLVNHARDLGGIVVVSIFVNPLQFGPGEDLDRYPRTLDADVALLDGLADVVFAPAAAEMYPQGESSTRVTAGAVGGLFEGASRPGHFDGMLTVVAKLFGIAQPDVAVFGQKDAQQVHLVGRMVDDLNLPVTIAVVDTVREPDGLALSSRNRYLDADARAAAATLSRALADGVAACAGGAAAVLTAARVRVEAEPVVRLDYLVIVDQGTFREVAPNYHGPAFLLIAARVGSTRLIDNERITLP